MEGFDQELMKHICKFCNKNFPCGRSLGGHVRCHVINSPELRKHPKKKMKSKDSDKKVDKGLNQFSGCSSVVVDNKLCKECGKGFQSWKALFGHMKCHSKKLVSNNKKINSASLNHGSWLTHSDEENSDATKIYRIKRSRSRNRGNERYSHDKTSITTTSSSISMNNNNNNQISSNNASTSVVSEIDQDQETDVAMSLMMLSKDLGKWGDQLGKNLSENGCKMKKSVKTQVGMDFLGRSEVGLKGFEKISMKNDEFASCFGGIKGSSNKRKFECVTCNKCFHSYQALGGHKASHKKVKICFNSKPVNENAIGHEPMLDHDQTINGYDQETSGDHQEPSSFNLGDGSLNKTMVLVGHECSICLKMFSSGQALGGHKRSHLIVEHKPNQESYTNVIKKPDEQPIRETRRFLDLNMPPQEEEEESSTTKYKSYYWEDCSDHHNNYDSRLLGLLSTS